MSVMERRLQLLLDQGRYARVEAEARRSGRSVSAVIRAAIDVYFEPGAVARQEAAARFLALTEDVEGPEPDWAETKSLLESNPKLDAIP